MPRDGTHGWYQSDTNTENVSESSFGSYYTKSTNFPSGSFRFQETHFAGNYIGCAGATSFAYALQKKQVDLHRLCDKAIIVRNLYRLCRAVDINRLCEMIFTH